MKCIVCNCDIPQERAEALELLGNLDNPTCINHAPNSKVKGLYHGFSGIAPLVVVSDVGTDKTIWRENEQEKEVVEDFSYHMDEE